MSNDIEKNYKFFTTQGFDSSQFIKIFKEQIPELINFNVIHPHQDIYMPSIDEKEHLHYLCHYLERNGCTNILLENSYVDRYYLDDFTTYYLLAFPHYKKTCSRFHFLKLDEIFDEEAFFNNFILNSAYDQKFEEFYLGFTVIKPLPQFFFGRTCLKPNCWIYNVGDLLEGSSQEINSENIFFDYRYRANMVGIEVEFKSLPFQEQDPAIGRCASVSLWTAIHGCSKIFENIRTPSLSKITKLANIIPPSAERIYPTTGGLDEAQISNVIKRLGMEPEYKCAYDKYDTYFHYLPKEYLYSYGRLKIPAILLLSLTAQSKARHAVTMSGINYITNSYNYQENEPELDCIHLKSRELKSIFVHDDNVGPYLHCRVVQNLDDNYKLSLQIPRFKDGFRYQEDEAEITGVIFLVPDDIRIKFRQIYDNLYGLNALFNVFLESYENFERQLIWDVYLTNVPDFRSSIKNNLNLNNKIKKFLITNNCPHYLWKCRGYYLDGQKEINVVEIIVDATDLSEVSYISFIFFYQDSILRDFYEFIEEPKFYNDIVAQLQNETNFIKLRNKAREMLRIIESSKEQSEDESKAEGD